jgi:AcrR family transcriptional regulator
MPSNADKRPLRPGSPEWWLRREADATRRRPRPDGLSLHQITAAALELVDNHGAEALTMRRLAEHLGTAPSSLYRHVASREEVLALIVDAVLGGLVTTEAPGDDWQATLRSSAHAFRRQLLAHRNVVPLIAEAQMLGPNAMHQRESALRALIGAGFDPAIAVRCYLAVVHFTVANVQLAFREAASPSGRRSPLRKLFASQDPDALPTVVRHADDLAEHNSDAEFDFGLEALLDGTGKLAFADDAEVRGEARA